MRKLAEIDVSGKRILVRVDFNVPIIDGEIMDNFKLKASLPTINYLLQNKAKIILCSHLGRPKGKKDPQLSLKPVANRLSQLLGWEVKFVTDCIGKEVEKAVAELKPGEVLFLENLRFHLEEEKNDPNFARALAGLADLYVNDAFAVCHRAHASVDIITSFLPSFSGFLLEKEIQILSQLLHNPVHPFALILGGSKISDKVGMLKNLLNKVDLLLIGGAVSAIFLKSLGYPVGKTSIEEEMVRVCQRIVQGRKEDILLPSDVLVAYKPEKGQKPWVVKTDQIPDDCVIVDIGPETIELFGARLSQCQTVFWNGPLGLIEVPEFSFGTLKLAERLSRIRAAVIAGGGSTSAFISKAGLVDKFTFISMGGGALLKFMGGEKLPGIAALDR